MHVFTSITANYLPKAAALALSVKRQHPQAVFHLVLCDRMPVHPESVTAPFDTIINVTDLPIENLNSWIFKHRLVELCTAVKGTAFQYIADRFGAERIYYFDPDIVVLGPLDDLERTLDGCSALLTPHQCKPETDVQAMYDNEVCSLKHGVYNLGFLAVRMTDQGAASSTGGPIGCAASAMTISPRGCSPISDGSTWRRRFLMTSRSCATRSTMWQPGI